jgi:glycosyltransferase involved in cell wall biosynthesis
MKLCFIADATAVHTKRWVEYFSNFGHEVHLITYEPPGEPMAGVHLHVVDSIFSNLYLAFPLRHLKIMRIVKAIKPDIVHAHFIAKFGFHGALLGFHPLVMSAWGSDVLVIPNKSKLLWHFSKFSMKKADKIYAVSKDMETKIVSSFGIPNNCINVVPFGVDMTLFHPKSSLSEKQDGKTSVFSNRNFLEVYNIETLINAIPMIIGKKKNIHFVIKGSGPMEMSLKKLANDLNVNEYVTFVGWTEYHDMPKYLHNCDIYVSTAISDGTPVSVLEAMACGKACIVTDVGGVGEWIEDGVSGCLIPPQKPQILAEKILELGRDPSKCEVLGKEAHRVITERGDWYNIMEWVRDDYKTLVR